MSNEVLFWTQVGSALMFVTTLLGLYGVLVKSKDATIESLRQEISFLQTRLDDAAQTRPDVLAERLTARNKALTEELERLSGDEEQNAALIRMRESELRKNGEELERLRRDLERAKGVLEELTCPTCGAIIVERGHATESVHHMGREVDIDHEWIAYECGLRIVDGVAETPCRSTLAGSHGV